jgi:hypothetical protein
MHENTKRMQCMQRAQVVASARLSPLIQDSKATRTPCQRKKNRIIIDVTETENQLIARGDCRRLDFNVKL